MSLLFSELIRKPTQQEVTLFVPAFSRSYIYNRPRMKWVGIIAHNGVTTLCVYSALF